MLLPAAGSTLPRLAAALFLGAAGFVAVTVPAFALTVTLNGHAFSEVTSIADSADWHDSPESVPTSGAPTIASGGSSSTTTYSLSIDGFNFTFDDVRSAASNVSAGSTATIYFSVDTNVDYVLSGAYASDATSGNLRTLLDAQIYDFDTGKYTVQSAQLSTSTPNESFTLGQFGGDTFNQLNGSLTGTLIAGHQYQFNCDGNLIGGISSPAAAHATGFVNLAFVPEPSTAVLLLAGLLGLAYRQRRQGRLVGSSSG